MLKIKDKAPDFSHEGVILYLHIESVASFRRKPEEFLQVIAQLS